MKKYQLIILSIVLSVAVTSSSAQEPGFSYSLVASKKGYEKVYKPGTKICIKYGNDSATKKIKGFLAGVADGKIVITLKKKSKVQVIIPVEKIDMLRKIRPGKRIFYGVAGMSLVAGGAAVLEQTSSGGSGMAGALMIPVIGAGVYILCVIPVTLLLEKINEKKRNSGWSFSVQQYR